MANMAQHSVSSKMTLRLILVAAWLLAFPLDLAQGLVTGAAFLSFCLVPISTSAIFSIILYRLPRIELPGQSRRCAILRNPIVIVAIDLLHASLLFIFLILAFTDRWSWEYHETSVLSAIATMPPMLYLCIHLSLAISSLYEISKCIQSSECPRCHSSDLPSVRQRGTGHAIIAARDEEENLYRDGDQEDAVAIRPDSDEIDRKL